MTFTVPKKGEKKSSASLHRRNAAMVLAKGQGAAYPGGRKNNGGCKDELEQIIGIAGIHRMEAFDISNTNGFASVGFHGCLRGRKAKAERLPEISY